jgi:hypothetical protein
MNLASKQGLGGKQLPRIQRKCRAALSACGHAAAADGRNKAACSRQGAASGRGLFSGEFSGILLV